MPSDVCYLPAFSLPSEFPFPVILFVHDSYSSFQFELATHIASHIASHTFAICLTILSFSFSLILSSFPSLIVLMTDVSTTNRTTLLRVSNCPYHHSSRDDCDNHRREHPRLSLSSSSEETTATSELLTCLSCHFG